MKIKVDRPFADAVVAVSKIASKEHPIIMKVDRDGINLFATDARLYVRVFWPYAEPTEVEPFQITLDEQFFPAVVEQSFKAGDNVTMSFEHDKITGSVKQVLFKSGRREGKVLPVAGEFFTPRNQVKTCFQFSISQLTRMVAGIAYAAGDISNPVFNGVFVDVNRGSFDMMTTDGFRGAAYLDIPCNSEFSASVIVPNASLTKGLNFIQQVATTDQVSVFVATSTFYMECDNAAVYINGVSGSYPKAKPYYTMKGVSGFSANLYDIVNYMKSTANRFTIVEQGDGTLRISATSEQGEAFDYIVPDSLNGAVSAELSTTFISAALSKFTREKPVNFSFLGERQPIILSQNGYPLYAFVMAYGR
jgi:hypothetical protein